MAGMAIEQPKFKIIQKEDNIEVREYEGYIVASVTTSAENHARAGNQGFSPLANYIFGGNKVNQKMPMTAPVLTKQAATGKKLPMTVPVLTTGIESNKYEISFVMPSGYQKKDLPVPNNSDVKLSEVKKHKALAIKFSGLTMEGKINHKIKELKNWAKTKDIELEGSPLLARYDAPWKPGFLRHNEIIIRCK